MDRDQAWWGQNFSIDKLYNKEVLKFIYNVAIRKNLFENTKYLWLGLLLIVFPTGSYAFQYKNLDLKITGTIAEMYDDNLTFTKEDSQEDYITTLGLGLNTKYEGKRRAVDLSGRMNYRFNAKYEDIKNNSENAAINFQNAFSESHSMGLRYVFSHSHTPESFEEELERASGRRESFRHNFSTNYLMFVSERLRVNALYSYVSTQFSEEAREDIYNSNLGLQTSYLVGSATTFSLSYSQGRDNFDSEIHNASLGLRYDMTQISYFDGRIGWDISSSGAHKNNNFNADISFNNQIDEITSVSVSYSQGEHFNSEEGNVSSNWQGSGTFSRQLMSRLNASLSGFYGEETFVLSEATNTLLGSNLSLAYELWEDLSAGIQYSYSELGSTEEEVGYIRNAITLNLSKSF